MYLKSWCKNIEEGAIEQANNLVSLPFAFHHVALMPDAHQGYGMPIGGVLATEGVIIPNAVGVDIGCGVTIVETGINIKDFNGDDLKSALGSIRKNVPVGFNSHKEDVFIPSNLSMSIDNEFFHIDMPGLSASEIIKKSKKQMGTLGGGNHFIEIQKDCDGYIWIMVHSGSRNVGYTIANYFNNLAIELNKKWRSVGCNDLSFLPIDSDEGKNYLIAMNYAAEFAWNNRRRIIDKSILALSEIGNFSGGFQSDSCHNYVEIESHYGSNVWVHRKGAIRARKGDTCIIPGSQGTNSYIGIGLGNPESFMSCSHGAGRKMSRSKARKELNVELEKKMLDDMGVIHAIRSEKDLDEAPSAYKNIHEVMEAQNDLVKITKELTPIAVIKG